MPNGHDKNFRRLLMTCAAYRGKFGEWPTQVRIYPAAVYDLAHILSPEDFEKLGNSFEIRVIDEIDFSAGGRGVFRYSDYDHSFENDELIQLAENWLGVRPRH